MAAVGLEGHLAECGGERAGVAAAVFVVERAGVLTRASTKARADDGRWKNRWIKNWTHGTREGKWRCAAGGEKGEVVLKEH